MATIILVNGDSIDVDSVSQNRLIIFFKDFTIVDDLVNKCISGYYDGYQSYLDDGTLVKNYNKFREITIHPDEQNQMVATIVFDMLRDPESLEARIAELEKELAKSNDYAKAWQIITGEEST